MPRAKRCSPGGLAYHVINRGNGRGQIFYTPGDYAAFIDAMVDTVRIAPMRILGYCLMPNHWHLVLWPSNDGDLSRFVGWLTNTHVRRYRRFRDSDGMGHLYQGRFKSFVIEEDYHLLRVLRYVEANPVRARLVERAEDWKWSSVSARMAGAKLLHDWPVDRPANWNELINETQSINELRLVREAVKRSAPLGSNSWVETIAKKLCLESTLRPLGRPRRAKSQVHKKQDIIKTVAGTVS
jgi:putative transposase